jgi:release factor glutamine methyltransferase
MRHEPGLALFGGPDGLLPIRRLIRCLQRHALGRGLDIGLEVGAGQSRAVIAALRAALPRHQLRTVKDFGGHDRLVVAECRLEPS